jgi:hypothetical protein
MAWVQQTFDISGASSDKFGCGRTREHSRSSVAPEQMDFSIANCVNKKHRPSISTIKSQSVVSDRNISTECGARRTSYKDFAKRAMMQKQSSTGKNEGQKTKGRGPNEEQLDLLRDERGASAGRDDGGDRLRRPYVRRLNILAIKEAFAR